MKEKRPVSRLFLPSLVISSFATQPSGLIAGLLLIEMGLTFGHPVGVTGQILTTANILSVIAALALSVVSIRFGHKSLLLIGVGLLGVSALGCGFATSFTVLMLAFALTGVSKSMINPMSSALIGETLPEDRRSGAIGWIQAGTSIAYLVGAPVVSYIGASGGWRLAFLALMLPVALLSVAASIFGIPSHRDGDPSSDQCASPLAGFRKIFSNRSALFCLVGTVFANASWLAILGYVMSHYRESFGVTALHASILLSGLALSKTVGHLTVSPLIDRFGRKQLTVVSLILMGVTTVAFTNIDMLWVSIAFVVITCLLSGYMESAMASLNLEQVPEFRGPMMSLNAAAYGLGGSMGTGLGGFILLLYDYEGLGIVLGVLSLLSAVVYYLFTFDPTVEAHARAGSGD